MKRIRAFFQRLWRKWIADDDLSENWWGEVGDGGGFVWKPKGEHSGKLVVILPPTYTGQVSEVVIRRDTGILLEIGIGSGVANGGREHFRFVNPGEKYGKNIVVVAKMKKGLTVSYHIPNGSARVEK